MSRWMLLLAAVSCWPGSLGCDPDDACDRGYYADHGYCFLIDAATDLPPTGDASLEDGGEIEQNPNATFGTPCTKQSDCGGPAPVCGAPQLPVCTVINCLEPGADACPPPWVCIDVTKYEGAIPGVNSVCVNINP